MAKTTAIEASPTREIQVNGQQPRASAWTYRPNVDIFETPDEILLIADLPGASTQNINIGLEAGILTVQAHVPSRNEQHRSVRQEYGVGSFHRRFEIDETVDPDQISAEHYDGVLTVHLTKARQARPRRITVTG